MIEDELFARHSPEFLQAEELRSRIAYHDRLYYEKAKPEITDREYDILYRELVELEKAHPELISFESPTQKVGGRPSEKFARVKHIIPMLSLDKIDQSEEPSKEEEPDREQRSRVQDQNTLSELRSFDKTIRKYLGIQKVQYVMEPKVDGVSISVTYRNGKLVLGVTRGDGFEGDDITANLKTLRSIPLELNLMNPPPLLEVRGEAYISNKEFDELNTRLSIAGEKGFPNARNAAAGALKQLDPRNVAQRPISALFYAVGAVEGIEFESHSEMLEALEQYGLPTQKRWWVCNGIDEVLKIYEDQVIADYDEGQDLRQRLPYEIDGVVIKVNTIKDWSKIPGRTRAPGYAIVHKPVPWITPAETLLKTITIQVGRTGVLTPVAELEPVFVAGSTVSRATLHNEDEIRRKDIQIGDTVVIRKAGMVIPEILEVVKSKRPVEAREFNFFDYVDGKCPACGGPIAKEKMSDGKQDAVAWRCQNVAGCPAQLTRRIEYFAQRKALDIDSLGGVVAEKLVERGMVKEPLDLFDLKLEQLAELNLGTDDEPRIFGEKNAAKIIEALTRAKSATLARWILALAISDIGEQTAIDLANYFPNLPASAESSLITDVVKLGEMKSLFDANKVGADEKYLSDSEKTARKLRQQEAKDRGNPIGKRLVDAGFANLSPNEKQYWKANPLIGPVSAKSIHDWASSEYGQRVLRKMSALQINPRGNNDQAGVKDKNNLGVFAGKVFVLTGTMSSLSRDEASRLIREAGGSVTSSVSKNTDFVLAGEKAGEKLQKAQELGVQILNENEFLSLVGSLTQLIASQDEHQKDLL